MTDIPLLPCFPMPTSSPAACDRSDSRLHCGTEVDRREAACPESLLQCRVFLADDRRSRLLPSFESSLPVMTRLTEVGTVVAGEMTDWHACSDHSSSVSSNQADPAAWAPLDGRRSCSDHASEGMWVKSGACLAGRSGATVRDANSQDLEISLSSSSS